MSGWYFIIILFGVWSSTQTMPLQFGPFQTEKACEFVKETMVLRLQKRQDFESYPCWEVRQP